jgi:hypothetical protein
MLDVATMKEPVAVQPAEAVIGSLAALPQVIEHLE